MTISTSWYLCLNLALVLICIYLIYRGWRKGFLLQLLNLVSAVVSFGAAYIFGIVLSKAFPISQMFPALSALSALEQYAVNWLFWIVAVFVIVRIVFHVIYASIRVLKKITIINFADHLFGAILSVITTWILCSVLAMFLSLPFIENGADFVNHSFLSAMNTVNMQIMDKALDGSVDFEQISQTVQERLR
jgi:uncharacterized membrane protein required for colicin V production